MALWRKPLAVIPNVPPPPRTQLPRGKVFQLKKRVGHEQRLIQASDRLQNDLASRSAFLRLELAAGGREKLVQTLTADVRERVRTNPEVDMEELCCDLVEGSFQDAETEGDLAMFRLLVSTVLITLQSNLPESSRSSHTGVTPRRVSRKMRPPAWYVKKQDDAKAILDGTPRVRTKYWNLRNVPKTTDVSDGDYVCDFPGCGRRYTTKGGLSHHKLITHKVGTFRQAGFDCKFCPRSFERDMWLTRHVNYDHALAIPFMCPFCLGYWPGAPSLRLHIAADHRFEEKDFPAPCALCLRDHQSSGTFKSVHQFEYHLKRFHL